MPCTRARTSVLTLVALVVLLVAGCAGDPCNSTGGGAASCAASLKFRHRTYLGTGVRIHSRNGGHGVAPRTPLHKIGVGVQPVCRDTNCPSSADVPRHFDVARIEGVSPTIAIVMLRWSFIYVRSGVPADRGSIKRLIQPKGGTASG
jgi:hypothetical protein